MESLTKISASTMAQLIRRKEISPVELIDAHLECIAELNPQLNAFVDVRTEAAQHEAQMAEAAVMRGEDIGSLHGVPVTIKSCIDVAGLRCEAGTRLRAGMVATTDAPLVQRLKSAGAIILGNTNVPEMLMAYETDNLLHGQTRNCWDTDRTPGGSSGGEATAIAACLSAAGVGSDAGGSIRVPAHFSGICGLKPTNGRVPATGHFPQSLGPFAMLGVVGPMARTVADLELMFAAMAGADWGDTSAAPVPIRPVADVREETLRIGYFEEDGVCPATKETREAVRSAAKSLQQQGYDVRPFRPSVLQQAREFWWICFVLTGAEVLKPVFQGREAEVSPILHDFFEIADRSYPLTKETLLKSWFGRDQIRLQLLAEMQQQDITAMISPVCAIPAFRHREREWKIDGQVVDYLQVMSYSQHFNLLGNPAAVVPIAHSPDRLPIGLQIIGKPYEDEILLRIAADVERQFGWREPALLQSVNSVASGLRVL
jgi:Asp-tRNA(Asn)/Glu-tRNA(Gln) amidotransferase A subunit family amidase